MAGKRAQAPDSTRRSYHHGELRDALVRKASEMVADKGVDRFRLREAVRSLGVDIASAYHHFKNRDALLGAVADDALAQLTTALERACACHAHPGDQLRALNRGYVRFAKRQPHLFRLVFSPLGIGPQTQPTDVDTVPPPGRVFMEVIDRCAEVGLTARSSVDCGLLPWTGVHGLASLVADGVVPSKTAKQHVDEMTDGILRSLRLD
ncbi:MAG: TetR/AcrR family transcriptional regulator [Myxococcota bacterium]